MELPPHLAGPSVVREMDEMNEQRAEGSGSALPTVSTRSPTRPRAGKERAREDELSGPCASPPCELDLSLHPAYLADLPPSSTQPHVSRNARAYATSHAYRSSSLDRSPTVGHAAHGDADSWILPLSKPPPSSSSSSTASQLGDGAHARRMMGIRGPRTSPSTENAQAKLVPPLISPLRTRLPLLLDPSVELHPSYRTGTPTIQDPSPPVLSQASRTQPVTPSAMSSLATPRHRASPRSTPAPIPRLVASPPPLKLPVLPRRVTELQPDRQTPPHQCPQVAEGVPSFLHTPPRSDGHPRPTLSASSAPSGPRQPRVDVAAVQQALANLLTSPPPPPSVVVDLKTAADPSEPSSPAFRDLAWSLYAELGDDKLPRSLLPLLFNSQRDGPDASERARRLLRIFRDAAQDEPLSSSGETPKWWLSLRQLEETLEAGLEMVEVSAPASTTSMGVAILLREVWRTITTVDGTPSAGPRQGFLSYARRDELLWRWIGITVPRAEGDGHFLHHVPPVEPTTRVAQLARFLWCVGPSSPAGIRAFASTFVAGRTDATLVDEIESAVVRTCDARATRLKRGKFSDEDLAAAEALEADPSRDGDDLAIRDGTEVGSWVLDMVSRLPTVAADASRWAPALAHRSATSILLLSHLERRLTRDVCPVQATHIVASIVRLRALPPTFHVPVEDLQLFASTLLNAYPKLDILETEPLYHLLEAFIHGGHFAFSMRLYELLRAREREFIVPGELVIQLLRLAMEGETSTWAGPGLYVDYSAWGNEALEHADLLRFVQTIGARPQQGGMMLRAVAESLICYGDEIVTDELVIAIAQATYARLSHSVLHAHHLLTPYSDSLTASDILDLLPYLRGLLAPSGRPIPIEVYHLAYDLITHHPTPSNLARAEQAYAEMTPEQQKDEKVVQLLMEARVGLEPRRKAGQRLARAFEFKEGVERTSVARKGVGFEEEGTSKTTADVSRIVELADKLGFRAPGNGATPKKTWRMLVVIGLCRAGKVDVALEVWREAGRKGKLERGRKVAREMLARALELEGKTKEEVRGLMGEEEGEGRPGRKKRIGAAKEAKKALLEIEGREKQEMGLVGAGPEEDNLPSAQREGSDA